MRISCFRQTTLAYFFIALMLSGCNSQKKALEQSSTPRSVTGNNPDASARDRPLYKDDLWTPGEGWVHWEYHSRPSLIQVLARPNEFEGREIQIKGYLVVEFEGTAIYLSDKDAEYGIPNGFWVSFADNTLGLSDKQIAKQFNGKYVLLKGTFCSDDRGHLNSWPGGAFHRVSRLSELRKFLPRQKSSY